MFRIVLGIHLGGRVRAGMCAVLLAGLLCAMAATRADAYVYWNDSNGGQARISRASLDGTDVIGSFVANVGSPRGIAVGADHVYWANASASAIGRANIDGSNPNPTFITGLTGVEGVTADAGHIYWTTGGAIGRANLDGSGVNPTFITGASQPRRVAVNATHVYWTNALSTADTIGRANIDGSGANQSFITGVDKPAGVALDASFVYWTNETSFNIGRANLDGTGVNTTFGTTNDAFALGLAANSTNLYWPSFAAGDIGRAGINGSGVEPTFIDGAATVGPTSVAVDARQNTAPTVTMETPFVFFGQWQIRAQVNPGGAATTLKYEYGTTTAFGTVLPSNGTINAGSGAVTGPVQPQTLLDLAPGTTYYVRACANNEVTGAGVANQVCSAPVAFTTDGTSAPSANTGAASAVTNTTAQLNGTVTAHGLGSAYVFEYGTSLAFGNVTLPPGNAGSGTAGQPVSAPLSGLQPNTTYFYRLVATNSAGTTNGPVMAVTTSGTATAPTATTAASTDVTATRAWFAGTVNPSGVPTAFTVEYGTTTDFGQITPVESAGNFGGVVQVRVPAFNLTPGETYLYRVVATNSAGTSTGEVMSITTPTTPPKALYFANAGAWIARVGIDGTGSTGPFISGTSGLDGMVVTATHIYWTNGFTDTIGRASLDGSDVNQSFITGANHPSGLAVDSGHVYWGNFGNGQPGTDSVGRANLDGTDVNPSFITGAIGVAGVAVDAGHVYWSNFGANAIGRANLDGSTPSQGFITGLDNPNGLAVDAGHIYWTQYNASTIGRANIDGSAKNPGFLATAERPFDLAVDATHIFWTTQGALTPNTGTVARAHIDGSAIDQSLFGPLSSPHAIAVGS